MSTAKVIGDVMTQLPHSVGVNQTVQAAKDLMHEHNVRHLPVQQGGELIGVITDRDIHYALAMDKADSEEMKVEDAYTADPYIVAPTETLKDVVGTMGKDFFGCALIVEDTKLKGIFTTTDACRVLSETL